MKTKLVNVGWKEFELDKICEIVSGSTPSTIQKEYWNGEINWITPAEINKENNWYYSKTRKKITEKGLRSASINLFPRGTVMLTSRAPIGKVAIAGEEMCSNQGFKNFICDSKKINNEYLYFWLRTKKDYLNSLGHGATFKEISKKIVSKINIFLPILSDGTPDLKKQEEIVSILEKAEELKNKRKEVEEILDEYLKAVFYDMFLKDKEKFEVKPLGEICDVRDGTHDSPKYKDKGYALITSKNVVSGRLDFSKINYISKEDFDNINKRSKVDVGDIIMPMIGTIGNPLIIDGEPNFAIKNVALIKFTKTNISNHYIKFLFDSHYFDYLIGKVSRGGTQKFISLGNIRSFEIPIPPIKTQERFSKIFEVFKKQKRRLIEGKQESENIFNSLSQKAFAGALIK